MFKPSKMFESIPNSKTSTLQDPISEISEAMLITIKGCILRLLLPHFEGHFSIQDFKGCKFHSEISKFPYEWITNPQNPQGRLSKRNPGAQCNISAKSSNPKNSQFEDEENRVQQSDIACEKLRIELFAFSISKLIDQIAYYYEFLSTSCMVVYLCYIQKYFKCNPEKKFSSFKEVKRLLFVLFTIAFKYTEDLDVEHEYTLDVCKELRIYRRQEQVNAKTTELMGCLINDLFVNNNSFNIWEREIFEEADVIGPEVYDIIDDYFYSQNSRDLRKNKPTKNGKSRTPAAKNCALLLGGHIFKNNKEAEHFYEMISNADTMTTISTLN
ncbi:unnamed protein product [Moneuplotes crassus]|uniref:Uncharacterized protein n=1 Tax=Euplotes crassus TaxID=5936 RepID=A0AAD1XIC6_EUPCR|nr:unnamed protein product [Moneuplotes crassus]